MDIIIAEDNIVSARLMQKMLEKEKHVVHTAKNGEEAISLIESTKSRIIISDWVMPHMDGIALCKKIREKFTSPYIYTILLTSKSDVEDTIHAFDAGADDYIIKPFNPKELVARITVGQRIIELEDKFEKASVQLLQSEKMAAIGQLSAGIAHEINNPIGFVKSNLKSLDGYLKELISAITQMTEIVESNLENKIPELQKLKEVKSFLEQIDITFIMEDIPDLLKDCIEGTDRIGKIVTDMKNFAHPGTNKPKLADLNQCIDSTLNVVWNDIKYKAQIIKSYGDIPEIHCFPQKLNQVFMNLLLNAAQAIPDKGKIKITTESQKTNVLIKIADNGSGIKKEHLQKIFDPFFTTKAVGTGTGLGLNVVYNIVKMHEGTINVNSQLGKGTVFKILLPIDPKIKNTEANE